MNNIDKIVDFISECSEYIYDYASTYTGKYTPVDHRKWEDKFLILWQQYKFNLRRIKEGIDNGTIIVNNFNLFDDKPKLKNLYPELYKRHLEGLYKFEKKYKNII